MLYRHDGPLGQKNVAYCHTMYVFYGGLLIDSLQACAHARVRVCVCVCVCVCVSCLMTFCTVEEVQLLDRTEAHARHCVMCMCIYYLLIYLF